MLDLSIYEWRNVNLKWAAEKQTGCCHEIKGFRHKKGKIIIQTNTTNTTYGEAFARHREFGGSHEPRD